MAENDGMDAFQGSRFDVNAFDLLAKTGTLLKLRTLNQQLSTEIAQLGRQYAQASDLISKTASVVEAARAAESSRAAAPSNQILSVKIVAIADDVAAQIGRREAVNRRSAVPILAAGSTEIPLTKELLRVIDTIAPALKDIVWNLHGVVYNIGLALWNASTLVFNVDKLLGTLTNAGVLPLSNVSTFVGEILDKTRSSIDDTLTSVTGYAATVVEFAGRFLDYTGRWLAGTLNRVASFVDRLIRYIIAEDLGPAVDKIIDRATGRLVTALIGAGYAIGNIFAGLAGYVGDVVTTKILNAALPDRFKFVEPTRPAIGDLAKEGYRAGERVAKTTFGFGEESAPAPGAQGKGKRGRSRRPSLSLEGFGPPELPVYGAPEPFALALTEPSLTLPRPTLGFGIGELALDPTIQALAGAPELARRLGFVFAGDNVPNLRLSEPTLHAPARAGIAATPGSAAITLNGGIHVQITAQTVDEAHAADAARAIAEKVLDELKRMTELERFRRGLPTGPIT